MGVGHGLELPYVKFKVTITEFAYKSGQQFEENIRHSTVIALGIHSLHIAAVLEGISVEKNIVKDLDLQTFVDTFALKPRKLKL